ncbi:hypothetical protein D1610_16775 [Sphingomonas gilva]|uniref:Uncharacterized protein n=2 Tax=Sphingomonas gilva TaxID=2305907 RepID=A0A396RM87_9SPHN|nr:hypothetical protein D1610_16775 [Sphingomonas gilva]
MEDQREKIIQDHYFLAKFLQDNALLKRNLMSAIEDITDDFEVSSDDLTEDGLAMMKAGYEKWLGKVDNGMSPEDVTLLEKALKKVRGG